MNDLPDISRGTTYPISGTYADLDGSTDITGATIFFTIKDVEYDANATDTTATIKKTITVFTNAVAGLYDFEITPTDTQFVIPGTYYYDLKIKLASTKIYMLAEGKVKFDGSPTNRQT